MCINIKTLLIVLLFFPVLSSDEAFSGENTQKHIEKKALFLKVEKGETLHDVVIKGSDLIEILKVTDRNIRIKDSTIERGLDFKNVPVVRSKIEIINSEIQMDPENLYAVRTKVTHFSQPVSFSNTIFKGKTSFSGATFNREVRFNGATFNEKSVFALTKFEDTADFSAVSFKGEAIFDLTFFKKMASFWSAIFQEKTSFIATTFDGKTIFKDAVFVKDAFFPSADFNALADFSRSTFHKLAYFASAVFEKRLILRMIEFREYGNFRDAIIGQLDFNSMESPAVIVGRMDFKGSIISEAHFQDIFFENDIDFSDAIFLRVLFKDVSFEEDAYFLRTKFRLQTAFYGTRFKKVVDFTDADLRSNQQFLISYTHFKTLQVNWSQLPPLRVWQNDAEKKIESFLDIEKAQTPIEKNKETRVKIGGVEELTEVVSSLEKTFRAQNQLKDANRAYHELKTLELYQAREGKTLWQWFIKQPTWVIWWATTGFGMQLGWITLWCLGINLFFTGLYFFGGRLSPSPQPDDAFKLRVLDFPKRYYIEKETESPKEAENSVTRFLDLFIFSAVILMKVGYRGKVIEGQIAGLHYRWIVRLEWLLGLYLLPAWSYTLQNVVPVVNKLMTGIF